MPFFGWHPAAAPEAPGDQPHKFVIFVVRGLPKIIGTFLPIIRIFIFWGLCNAGVPLILETTVTGSTYLIYYLEDSCILLMGLQCANYKVHTFSTLTRSMSLDP